MSNLLKHARAEMRAAGLYNADADYGGAVARAVEEIVQVFASQGHSGSSAALTTSIVERVLRYEPLTPLSGEEDEWTEVSPGLQQNKRCSRVFKDTEKGAYALSGNTLVPVTFPYMPTN